MRPAHPFERAVGIDHYVSDADGVGGRLRSRPEDFRVREREAVSVQPTDADPGSYPDLVFRATLRNWDTNDFASALADRLGISRERVSWAGTKDKHAITTQLFSVRGVEGEDLPDVRGADVEVLGRAGRPVLFGDLRGNHFELTVRDVEAPGNASLVTDQLREFCGGGAGKSDGDGGEGTTVCVPNFFGQQRFGAMRPVTHEVGLAIVRDDYEGAVMAYVGSPDEREPEATREARAFVEETRDWKAALDRLPTQLGYERSMVHRLVENGAESQEDFHEALRAVPTNVQRLFVNAAQSSLYNRMLSERLARGLPFGRPVAGDVVCFTDEHGDPDTDRLQRVDEGRVDTVTRHCERGRAFVTAPLVGTETELADGEQGDIERAVLDEAGLAPGDFERTGEFDSTGTRRAIQVRTDLTVEAGEDDEDDTLTFGFALPAGSYATVLMREFLKADPVDL
ncbi:tRNA pseudouridine(13) synthase TruD [Halomarina litorea]|uniref:tRNA pseudouridine(13) synthase TruD n=1 Tax=Halomarina litorea TaxID=2961595 RepID=UPI0020C52251|nr:tRNA pseudouridine(13) synthase TruD [Halomarina sp. BCD28]